MVPRFSSRKGIVMASGRETRVPVLAACKSKVSAGGSGAGGGQGSSNHHGKGGDQDQRHAHNMNRNIGWVVMIGTILCTRSMLVAARVCALPQLGLGMTGGAYEGELFF